MNTTTASPAPSEPTALETTPPEVSTAPEKKFNLGPSMAITAATILLIVAPAGVIFAGLLTTKVQVAIACLILLFGLMAAKVPLAAAMGLTGMIGIWRIAGDHVLEQTLIDLPSSSASSWSLSVIPMFVFMGLLLWRSGATGRIFDVSRAWLNWLPGGQAITTNMAGSGLAAASGSTIGITYAISRIGIPEMLRSGYDKRLAIGSVLMAGLPGQLIPPSLLLVVYAGVANLAVGPQLLAGVVPGLLLTMVINLAILILAVVFPRLTGDKGGPVSWNERWATLLRVWPLPILITVILGGMYTGIVTATEAAALGCIGALLITAVYVRGREFFVAVGQALRDTLLATGSVFFLLIGAAFINRMLALSGVPFLFTQWVESMGLGPTQFVIAAIAIILVLGMFMDPISLMLLSIPVMLPTLTTLDVNLIWFGVLVVIAAEIGMLTPPVGVLVFLVHKIAQSPEVNQGQRISLPMVFGAALIGAPLALLVIAILIAFPDIVTWLPATSSST